MRMAWENGFVLFLVNSAIVCAFAPLAGIMPAAANATRTGLRPFMVSLPWNAPLFGRHSTMPMQMGRGYLASTRFAAAGARGLKNEADRAHTIERIGMVIAPFDLVEAERAVSGPG